MAALVRCAPYLMVALGLLALRGGWRCYADPERAGIWARPATAVVVATAFLGLATPTVLAFGGVISSGGVFNPWPVIWSLLLMVAIAALYGMLFAYHLGIAVSRALIPEDEPPDESADPMQRAVDAEERGEVRAAVERYTRLLEAEPGHVLARTRLAHLLARTRWVERAVEILADGIALDSVPEEAKRNWRSLAEMWQRGDIDEKPPVSGPIRHRSYGEVKTPRLDAWREADGVDRTG